MSTFCGTIPEFPGLMIDRFEAGPAIKAYFLSHDHADHQNGINDPDLKSHIITNGLKIYASPLTVRMVRNREKFSELHASFCPLELDVPHRITIESGGERYSVVVTLTAAEHIVGSVMFLLEREKPNYRCLYTGDFRLTKKDLKLKKCFKLHRGVKPINAVYFDSTWCTPKNVWNIPTREEVLQYLKPLVDGHLQADEANYICLYTMYDVGYENLLQELAKLAGSEIHVTDERLSLYRGFTGITDIFTSDPSHCRIHFCQKGYPARSKSCYKVRQDYSSGRVMKLMFSYRSFIAEHTDNLEQNVYVRSKRTKDIYHVCWSTHPSLEEVSDLLNYLSPDIVRANVIGDFSEEEILTTLQRGSITPKKWHPITSSEKDVSGTKRKHKQESNSQSSCSTDDSPSESLLDRLRGKGCMEKRRASPAPSLALLENTKSNTLM